MSTKHATGVSYLRVSGAGQIDGDGFPRQRQAIERYAREKRVTIAEEFRDEAISGTKPLAERPGMLALFEYLRAHSPTRRCSTN